MANFLPQTAPIPTPRMPGLPTTAPIPTPAPGPRTVSFNTPTPAPTGGAMTLDALMARQKAAAAAQQGAMATPQSTIPGGIGQMLTSYLEGMKGYKAEQEEMTGREEITQAMLGIPESGIIDPEGLATIMRRDPDLGLALYQEAMKARQEAAKLAAEKAGTGEGTAFDAEMKLRKEFEDTDIAKSYGMYRGAYERLREGAKGKNAAGDVAMIYAYMKMHDPTSVIRENEQATAQNAGGIPTWITSAYNKALTGELLDKSVRRQFLNMGKAIYKGVETNYKQSVSRYGDVATQNKLNPANITTAPNEYTDLNPSEYGYGKDAGAMAGDPSFVPQEGDYMTDKEGNFRVYTGGDPEDGKNWGIVR
jgi:hypothetical protein